MLRRILGYSSPATDDRAHSGEGSHSAPPRSQRPNPAAPDLPPRGSGNSQARRAVPASRALLPIETPQAYLGAMPEFVQQLKEWRSKVETEYVSPETLAKVVPTGSIRRSLSERAEMLAMTIAQAAGGRQLSIDVSPFSTLPSAIGRLPFLEKLEISRAACPELPNSIAQLANLKYLTLSFNPELRHLPAQIGQLKSLKSLKVSDSPLESVPNSIGELSQLETLKLSSWECKQLPPSLGNLKALKELDIFMPYLQSLPPLGGLAALEILSVKHGSGLKTLPSDLGSLAKLRKLDLRNCGGLTDLPASLRNLNERCEILVPQHLQGRLTEIRESDIDEPEEVEPGCLW